MSETVKLQTIRWMKEVHPFNKTDDRFYILGELVDHPGFLVVVDHSAGRSWFYCNKHNAVFTIMGQCPACLGEERIPTETVQTEQLALPDAN